MPVDTQQILDAADKVGQMVAQHPAVERYKQAQQTLSQDPDAARMLNEFNRQLMTLARQEEAGMPVTDAQRHSLESLQTQLASHIKIKAFNLAQVEFVDLLRKVSDAIRSKVSDAQGAPGGPPPGAGGAPATPPPQPGGPRIVM
jgi:cell fate (sporulation/competence/biofilm development) regulator YlbF (YheA/YmcA/DUF963 family)